MPTLNEPQRHLFPVLLYPPDETGTLTVVCPVIQGCISQGSSISEALLNIQEAIRCCLEADERRGIALEDLLGVTSVMVAV